MLVTEYPYHGRDDIIRHSSDAGYTIVQNETGNEYGEAIDRYHCPYTYTETDHKIEEDETDE